MTENPRRRPLLPYRQLRELAGLSMSEVARRAGLTRQNANRVETSSGTRLATTLAYLRALGGTVTLTVSQGRAWMTWSRRVTSPPPAALPVDLYALDTDTTPANTPHTTSSKGFTAPPDDEGDTQ